MIRPKNPNLQKQWTPERRAKQAEIAREVNRKKKDPDQGEEQRSERA